MGDAVFNNDKCGRESFAVLRERPRRHYMIGPNGDVVTLADLPPTSTTRWVVRRKAEVVLAVRSGLITLEEACKRYRLTLEEFQSWQRSIEKHGLEALRTTTLQHYRQGGPNNAKGWGVPRPSQVDRFAFTDDDVS